MYTRVYMYVCMYVCVHTLLYTCAFQLLQMNSLTHIRYKKHFKNYFLPLSPFYMYWVYHGTCRTTFYFCVLLLSLINLHHIEFFVQPHFWENQPPPRRLPFFVGIK